MNYLSLTLTAVIGILTILLGLATTNPEVATTNLFAWFGLATSLNVTGVLKGLPIQIAPIYFYGFGGALLCFAVFQLFKRFERSRKIEMIPAMAVNDQGESEEKKRYELLSKLVSRKARIDGILPKIQGAIDSVEAHWADLHKIAHDKDFSLKAVRDGRSHRWPTDLFVGMVKQAQRTLLLDCGDIQVDLERYDEYNRNPHHYLGELPQINDELKQDYRRFFSLKEHSIGELRRVKSEFETELRSVTQQLAQS